MAKIKRSEDRTYTPKPEFLDADLTEEATPPPTVDPKDVPDEGDLTLTDDLAVSPEEPRIDRTEEQPDYREEVHDRDD